MSTHYALMNTTFLRATCNELQTTAIIRVSKAMLQCRKSPLNSTEIVSIIKIMQRGGV